MGLTAVAKSLDTVARELAGNPVKQPKAMQDADARLEKFELIKAEADKLGAVDGGGPDWDSLIRQAIYYLQKGERDLRVACYLARAWSAQDGLTGLRAGATLIDALLREQAAELVPARTRGRQHALDWWARHSRNQWQAELAATAGDDDLAALRGQLEALLALIQGDAQLAGQPKMLDGFLARLDGSEAPTGNAAAASAPQGNDDTPNDNPTPTDDATPAPSPDPASDSDLERFLASIAAPVGADDPIGKEEYLSEEFERIQAQVNATWRVQEVEWEDVFRECRDFLENMSKDLRVMAYCVFALLECNDITGLRRGLTGLKTFLDQFGADCHPRRAGGRRAALQWLAKSVDAWLRQREDANFALQDLKTCSTVCDEINAQLVADESLLVAGAALGKASRTLRDLLERAEAGQTVQPEPVAPAASSQSAPLLQPAAPTPASAPTSGPTEVDIGDDAGFRKAMGDGRGYVLKLVHYKRQADPADPFSYRLLRSWMWGSLGSTVNVAALRAPSSAAMPDWRTLLAAEDPIRLLETAEKMLVQHRFYLDLNRYANLALDALGHRDAGAAIRDELRRLLLRFPDLAQGAFMDGTAVADDATRNWIDAEVLIDPENRRPGSQIGAIVVDSSEESALETLTAARALAKSGDRREAVAMLARELDQAGCERERFAWRLRLARLFLELDAGELALAHVESLEQAIEGFGLERWDPTFAIEVADLARQLAAKIGRNPGLEARARKLDDTARARICRLRPADAIDGLGAPRK